MEKEKLSQKTWFTILWLIIFFPVGLFLMWKNKKFNTAVRVVITAILILGFFVRIGIITNSNTKTPVADTQSDTKTVASSNVSNEPESKDEAVSETETTVETETAANTESETEVLEPEAESQTVTESSDITMGQKNALSKAEDYLNYSAFSYSGLIKQLEYEQFSTEDATYAADNCGADWSEQAAKKAQEYLDFSSFSRDSLIDQLEYEGFTTEEAEYGATAVGY